MVHRDLDSSGAQLIRLICRTSFGVAEPCAPSKSPVVWQLRTYLQVVPMFVRERRETSMLGFQRPLGPVSGAFQCAFCLDRAKSTHMGACSRQPRALGRGCVCYQRFLGPASIYTSRSYTAV